MASGFIILKDGRCWSRKWNAYDEIIRIAIRELKIINGGLALSEWLTSIIPRIDIKDEDDAGWGFYDKKTDDWITRHFDTRSLTPSNQEIFWKAILNGSEKLHKCGQEYSDLYPEVLNRLVKMYELSKEGKEPLEMSDWNKIADVCNDKNGPDW